MGITHSRQVVRQLNEACTKADRVGLTRVTSFLGETFLRSAAAALNDLERNDALSKKIDDVLKGLALKRTLPKQKSSAQRTNHRALKCTLSFDTQITLQDDIKQCLMLWISNLSSFFEDNECLQFDPQKSVPTLVYKFLCHLDSKLVIDRARRRILLTVLYKLHALFELQRIKGRALNVLASAVLQSGLAGTNLGAIEKNLANWKKKGKRYSKLGDDLGGSGTIVLLPYDIGDTVWEHELPIEGPVHDETVNNIRRRGIWTEATKRLDVPILQPDGRDIVGQSSVHNIVQEVIDRLLKSMVWIVDPTATIQDQSTGPSTNHTSQASTHQDNGADPYASTLRGQALFLPRHDIHEHGGTGVRTQPTDFPTIATDLPTPQSQDHQEQSQQSSAHHLASLQHIMNPDPPEPFGFDFSSSAQDGPPIASTSGMMLDTTADHGFSHHGQASMGKVNPSPGVHESLPNQRLLYDGQHRIPPTLQEGERTLGSYESTARTSNLGSAAHPAEGVDEEYAPLFPEPDGSFATGIGDEYAPLFPEPVGGFSTDMSDDYAAFFHDSDNGFVTSTGGYGVEGFAHLHCPDRTDGPSLTNWPNVL